MTSSIKPKNGTLMGAFQAYYDSVVKVGEHEPTPDPKTFMELEQAKAKAKAKEDPYRQKRRIKWKI